MMAAGASSQSDPAGDVFSDPRRIWADEEVLADKSKWWCFPEDDRR
jgi:hypothetical protein